MESLNALIEPYFSYSPLTRPDKITLSAEVVKRRIDKLAVEFRDENGVTVMVEYPLPSDAKGFEETVNMVWKELGGAIEALTKKLYAVNVLNENRKIKGINYD